MPQAPGLLEWTETQPLSYSGQWVTSRVPRPRSACSASARSRGGPRRSPQRLFRARRSAEPLHPARDVSKASALRSAHPKGGRRRSHVAHWALRAERSSLAVRGFCSRCGRETGGLFRPRLWQCPKCKVVICEECTPERKVGLIFKKPVCPDCLIELVGDGVPPRSGR